MTSENRQTQLILDSIPSFVWLKDISNRILRVNQAVSEALGLPREAIEGRHAKEIYPDDAERFYEDDLAVIRSGQPRIGCRDKVGNRWLRVDKIPVHGDDGQIDRLLVIATDITELKHAEQAQDEARRLLEITGRLAELGGWNLDLPTNTLSWSEQVCLIHEVPVGYQPTVEEAIDFYVPESRERIRQHVQLAIDTGKPWDEELAIRTKKGREVWVRAIGEAEVVEGECVRLWGTFQDISARKRRDRDLAKLNKQLIRRAKEAEEARQKAENAEAELATAVARLTDSEERYRTLFESSPVMHANVSPEDATIRDCNQMLVTRLGYGDKSELVGRSIHSLYSETCREKVNQAFERFVRDGEVKNASLSLVTRSGGEIPVSLNVASVRDSTGKVLYSSSTWSDVTELTKANHDLREFAYVASHDLKAPLRAISHLANWIEEDLEGAMGKSSEQHLAQLKQRILRMERLLDDLLVYSRAGHAGGSTQRVDLGELIEGIAGLHGSEEHFLVCVDLAVREVEVCETPLETVLRNLVSNAIKHHDGDRKRIDIKAQILDGSLEISVIDDGPGIPAELHDRAFRMFQTLRPRDEVEGSGMGLPLAKRLIESYGGEIKIEQAEPRGACIRFTWPIGVIHAQQ